MPLWEIWTGFQAQIKQQQHIQRLVLFFILITQTRYIFKTCLTFVYSMDLGQTFALNFLIPVTEDDGALITTGGAVLTLLLVKDTVFPPRTVGEEGQPYKKCILGIYCTSYPCAFK